MGALYELAGRHFCVSHYRPDQVARVHEQAQSVMLDNGAFSHFRKDQPKFEWSDYYAWCDTWLDYPTTWAVIPDVIKAGSQEQDALIREWPHGHRGAPVWHMDEPIDRMLRLLDEWPRVCIGSTEEYWRIKSPAWSRQMDATWDAISARHQKTPWVHMLRGMQLSSGPYPFASVDSTDIAQNHNRAQNTPRKMADRWDAIQPPPRWIVEVEQLDMYGGEYGRTLAEIHHQMVGLKAC
jgi:hypothetical protein